MVKLTGVEYMDPAGTNLASIIEKIFVWYGIYGKVFAVEMLPDLGKNFELEA